LSTPRGGRGPQEFAHRIAQSFAVRAAKPPAASRSAHGTFLALGCSVMSGYLHWPILFCLFGLLFTAAELLRPARPLNYRAVLRSDLMALATYGLVLLPVSMHLSRALIKPEYFVLRSLLELPLVVRLVLYYVLADLGLYAMHRLMHTRYLWRIHRWHHSPPYMYWLAGIRASVPNQVLFNLPFVFCAPLLHHAPPWLFMLIFAEGFFQNNWMHMNVTWRSRRLERVLVTPRYHHVHHSRNPEHHTANLGSRLTIWDRVFETYVDPEAAGNIAFGIEDQASPARLALGV
jgi:sterol desaturase/sphingolipid hydroxylase (fatty acid hydroxylase superfamily)